ncbi:MAG: glycosyltransferase family 4 protein [Sphingomicrobium sp.]
MCDPAEPDERPGAPRPIVVLSANSTWNIVNFRAGLIRALRSAGYAPVVIAPRDAAADSRMRELGVECITVPIDRSGVNPAADLRLLRAYRRLLERLRPAAYLGYTIKPNIYGAMAAARLGIPAIPNVSGLGTAFIRNGLLQQIVVRLYRIGFRRAPVVFFQNAEDRQLFVERRIVRPDQARVLPGSGVDLERFSPAPAPGGPPAFLFIGRLLRDKGVAEFIAAARLLRRELPEARFQLLGPIDDANRTAVDPHELQSWISEGVVEHLGTTDDVRPFIAAATAVVLPSYREGLPRSLLEAGAMERPLIATDVPGCREVVEDGINGLLCKVRDPQSLAASMRRIAGMPAAELAAMGAAARQRVQDRFSEAVVVGIYLDVLRKVRAAPELRG